jgi:hypothetical protein
MSGQAQEGSEPLLRLGRLELVGGEAKCAARPRGRGLGALPQLLNSCSTADSSSEVGERFAGAVLAGTAMHDALWIALLNAIAASSFNVWPISAKSFGVFLLPLVLWLLGWLRRR